MAMTRTVDEAPHNRAAMNDDIEEAADDQPQTNDQNRIGPAQDLSLQRGSTRRLCRPIVHYGASSGDRPRSQGDFNKSLAFPTDWRVLRLFLASCDSGRGRYDLVGLAP